MLRHECFADAKGNAALIECLIGGDGHSCLVADTEKKKSSLGTINRDLTNQLIYSP